MKISVITCHRSFNYGAVLQTYAFQEYLRAQGHSPFVMDYFPEYFRLRTAKTAKRLLKKVLQYPERRRCKKTFDAFLDKYVSLSKKTYKTFEELKASYEKADLYIAGSDQVWNMNMRNGNDDSFFLKFVQEPKKKVSYATSIAMDQLNEKQIERIKEMIRDYLAVSVRETSGVRMLGELGIRCSHVCDPVFLQTKEHWLRLSKKKDYGEEYVLVYAFYGQKEVYAHARQLAKRYGCKVYSINTRLSDKFRGIDRYFWAVEPEEYLNLFANARAVVTNSFHGTAFSMIFQKEAFVFKTGTLGNVRLIDLAKDLGVYCERPQSSLIAEISAGDYEKINKELGVIIEESKAFLADCGI